jgi:anthranilate synthase component II
LIKKLRKNKVLIIDNYDSFTYNLVHLVEKIIDHEVTVFLNDSFEIDAVHSFDKIIISPGPGLPKQAGRTLDVILKYASSKSILGVCLGQQAIAEAFGGKLKNLNEVFHGVAHEIIITPNYHQKSNYLFKNLPQKIEVGRYHSWVIDQQSFPAEFNITAVDEHNEIMAIEHKNFDIQAVQFHPESIMTRVGEQILSNWFEVH